MQAHTYGQRCAAAWRVVRAGAADPTGEPQTRRISESNAAHSVMVTHADLEGAAGDDLEATMTDIITTKSTCSATPRSLMGRLSSTAGLDRLQAAPGDKHVLVARGLQVRGLDGRARLGARVWLL